MYLLVPKKGPVPLIAGPIYSELSGSRNHHSNTMVIPMPFLLPWPALPFGSVFEELSHTLGFSKEKDFHLQSMPQLGEIWLVSAGIASGESAGFPWFFDDFSGTPGNDMDISKIMFFFFLLLAKMIQRFRFACIYHDISV